MIVRKHVKSSCARSTAATRSTFIRRLARVEEPLALVVLAVTLGHLSGYGIFQILGARRGAAVAWVGHEQTRLHGGKQMKRLSLSRHALGACIAGTLFVGCGGPQAQGWSAPPLLPSSAKLSNESEKRAAGGAFTASYSGTYKHGCSFDFICYYKYHGAGSGPFVHRSTSVGEVVCGSGSAAGVFTFRSAKHPRDAFTVSTDSCGSTAKYTVSGGKGKFSDASGSGTVSFSYKRLHHFTASWVGTLNY